MSYPYQGSPEDKVPESQQPTQIAPTGWPQPGQAGHPPTPGTPSPHYGAWQQPYSPPPPYGAAQQSAGVPPGGAYEPPPIEQMPGQPAPFATPPPGYGYSPPQPGMAPWAGYPPPSYPAPGYPAGGYPAQQPANRLAVWALVLSLIGVPLGLIVIGNAALIAGIVMGIVALNQISRTHQPGRGLAIAAISIGALALIILVVFWDPGFFEGFFEGLRGQ